MSGVWLAHCCQSACSFSPGALACQSRSVKANFIRPIFSRRSADCRAEHSAKHSASLVRKALGFTRNCGESLVYPNGLSERIVGRQSLFFNTTDAFFEDKQIVCLFSRLRREAQLNILVEVVDPVIIIFVDLTASRFQITAADIIDAVAAGRIGHPNIRRMSTL